MLRSVAVIEGRIQRQVRRRLIVADGEPVSFEDLMRWSYAGGRLPWRWPIYRALRLANASH